MAEETKSNVDEADEALREADKEAVDAKEDADNANRADIEAKAEEMLLK